MTITQYMTYNQFICTIVFHLSESLTIILFKDFILKINEVKVTKNSKKKSFYATLALKIFSIRSLNEVILDDSDRWKTIVQTNGLYVKYNVIIIETFDVKVVYSIYHMIYTSRNYGNFPILLGYN